MSTPVALHPSVVMRKPRVANPYRHYPSACAAVVLLSVAGGVVSLALLPAGMALVLGVCIAFGSIALLSGFLLLPFVAAGQRRVESLAQGEFLVYWTYPADAWNRFAASMRESLRPQQLVPISLFPACGCAAGFTLALLEHWAAATINSTDTQWTPGRMDIWPHDRHAVGAVGTR